MQKYSPQTLELQIANYWNKAKIFQMSIKNREQSKKFVFLEGPPTANGLPGIHHVLARTFKDIYCRYKTMQGFLVERKGGWDTHGLPVEIEVEKDLKLSSKQEVEKFGIKEFNKKCKESVFKYEREWKKMTERMGFWLEMENPYITLKNEYIESVWWSLKQIWDKGLLYKGHKVIPYCARCGTALSSHEVAQGYEEVEENSVYVKFKIKGEENLYFLAWTTTPWTLISNVALAVHPDAWYVQISVNGERLILAEQLMEKIFGKDAVVISRFQGIDIEGKPYEQLFKYCKTDKRAFYIITADFVTLEEGTGIVHIAPAFGEDDYNVGKNYDLPLIQPVDLNGKFTEEVSDLRGEFVKDADEKIVKILKDRNLLLKEEKYKHSYPFCWRCNSPLLYYARESWFIKMTEVKDNLLNNNEKINWIPEHLKKGRFGDFLSTVKDWSLSRERYWGTPLPIWKCSCGREDCIGSIKELKEKAINFNEVYKSELDLHKPFIDEVKLKCNCGKEMRREVYVIDCWYDSGSSFFAQWHYPFENEEKFKENFPIDFISEGIDQTRGWFYTLHAIATLVFNSNAYNNCLTLGLVLDKDGQKMSKSKGNVVLPETIFNHEGVDALRWYFLTVNPPYIEKRFSEKVVKESLGKFLLTLWNSYSFYKTYSALDKFNYSENYIGIENRSLLDIWIISKLNKLIKEVKENMDNYETQKASRLIEDFVINDLSNWFVRRSRKRFWVEEFTEDKQSGYCTLYETILTIAKLIAPLTPFIADEIYLNLVKTETEFLSFGKDGIIELKKKESIHLCNYPKENEKLIDEELNKSMERIKKLAELGRSLRNLAEIKVRIPLKEVYIICSKEIMKELFILSKILQEEINVKEVIFETEIGKFLQHKIKPNFATLGKKFKAKSKEIANELLKINAEKAVSELEKNKNLIIKIENEEFSLTEEDIIIEKIEKENYKTAKTEDMTLVLNTELTDALRAEGLARELIRRIQEMRKELNLEMMEVVDCLIEIDENAEQLIKNWKEFIANETRTKLVFGNAEGFVKEWKIEELRVRVGMRE